MRDTSLDAYRQLIESGELHAQESAYLNLLSLYRDMGLTDGQAAMILEMPRSTVSARRNGVMQKLARALGHHAIVNVDNERRRNPGEKSKSGLVWRLRE